VFPHHFMWLPVPEIPFFFPVNTTSHLFCQHSDKMCHLWQWLEGFDPKDSLLPPLISHGALDISTAAYVYLLVSP
jgi:hypothetical protein